VRGRGPSIARAVLFMVCAAVLVAALIGGTLVTARAVVSVVNDIGNEVVQGK